MSTPLIPQEVYLLERYTSPDYFADMRDAWADMVGVARAALKAFMTEPPSRYRSRPLNAQPDIVWEGVVLRNFECTLDSLVKGFIELTHGDLHMLHCANRVHNDFCGFSRGYSAEWMDAPSVVALIPHACKKFWDYLGSSTTYSSNILASVEGAWSVGALSSEYNSARGPLNPPAQWPSYRLNPEIRVFTGCPVPCSGVYLPDIGNSTPAFQIKGDQAHLVRVGRDPDTGHCLQKQHGWWTLVERGKN